MKTLAFHVTCSKLGRVKGIIGSKRGYGYTRATDCESIAHTRSTPPKAFFPYIITTIAHLLYSSKSLSCLYCIHSLWLQQSLQSLLTSLSLWLHSSEALESQIQMPFPALLRLTERLWFPCLVMGHRYPSKPVSDHLNPR